MGIPDAKLIKLVNILAKHKIIQRILTVRRPLELQVVRILTKKLTPTPLLFAKVFFPLWISLYEDSHQRVLAARILTEKGSPEASLFCRSLFTSVNFPLWSAAVRIFSHQLKATSFCQSLFTSVNFPLWRFSQEGFAREFSHSRRPKSFRLCEFPIVKLLWEYSRSDSRPLYFAKVVFRLLGHLRTRPKLRLFGWLLLLLFAKVFWPALGK